MLGRKADGADVKVHPKGPGAKGAPGRCLFETVHRTGGLHMETGKRQKKLFFVEDFACGRGGSVRTNTRVEEGLHWVRGSRFETVKRLLISYGFLVTGFEKLVMVDSLG